MVQQSLFHLLTRSQIPAIRIRDDKVGGTNTRNDTYPPESVKPIRTGPFFAYNDIMDSPYAPQLFTTYVEGSPLNSPAQPVNTVENVKARILEYVQKRMRRALRNTWFPPMHSPLIMDVGCAAPFPGVNLCPDLAGHTSTYINRLPGEVRCSWKWDATMINSDNETDREQNLLVSAQINAYMNLGTTRYSYAITDTELVFFRKRESTYKSHVEMMPGIPLTLCDSSGEFTRASGRVTPLLALWYMHMLASHDERWYMDPLESDPESDNDDSGDF